MATTVVPVLDDGQGPIYQSLKATPYSPSWWTAQTITNIPADSVGWLVAQGWQITGITYDNTTVPPTPYYAMTRQSLQNWIILQGLLEEWTNSWNEAAFANTIRYNDVVLAWGNMLDTSHDYLKVQTSEQNAHVTLYLGNLSTYMDEVDALIDANQAQIVTDSNTAKVALEEANTQLDDFETNLVTSLAQIEVLLTNQQGNLATFLIDFAAELTELDTNYAAHVVIVEPLIESLDDALVTFKSEADAILTAILNDFTILDAEINSLLITDDATLGIHVADYNAVLALLEDDYSTHSVTATAFLTNLGVTDTARIAEKFTSVLSTQMQQLVDRGLYSSALATDVTARNTRDHNEEIVALNDRLMREKWENQHRLYGQQVQMRMSTMSGKDRMYGLRQELSRYHAAQIIGLYGLLQSVRDRTLATKQMILNVQQAVSQFTIEMRNRLLEIVNGIVAQQAAGIDRQYMAKQDVSRVEMTTRDRIIGILQDATKAIVAGKESYAAALMQLSSTLAEHKHRAIVEKMNEFNVRLSGLQGKHEEDMKLMAYQLDERNKLLIGIYQFVERREDVYPKFDDLSKIVTSLGDSGGGWLTP